MIKLKKIINHLDVAAFQTIENELVKNKANNFLFLLKSYREGVGDSSIIRELDISSNSFYVLKSRLYDKIQEHFSGDINISKEELIKKMDGVAVMCYTQSKEVTTAYLEKLEKDLLAFDMLNELLVIYSALKKINLYSEKYFHYSKLYNKHIAFCLSLEKSEEILGNFNRLFGQYDFSRSQLLLDNLMFSRKEIGDHFLLNPSRQVEIIKNFIEIQLCVFCKTELNNEINIEELLDKTNKIIEELPISSSYKTWQPALDYLFFEYYYKMGQIKKALHYYEKVNSNFQNILLYTNICNTSKFLISKIAFLQEQGRTKELLDEKAKITIFDSDDIHTKVLLGIYNSMVHYYSGKYKDAISCLNELLNENSFKDYFHINTDIKLTLALFYNIIKNHDLAENILKSIYRKIKSEKIDNYNNVLFLIKLIENGIKDSNNKVTEKQKNDFILFSSKNKNESELLKHFAAELSEKYN